MNKTPFVSALFNVIQKQPYSTSYDNSPFPHHMKTALFNDKEKGPCSMP